MSTRYKIVKSKTSPYLYFLTSTNLRASIGFKSNGDTVYNIDTNDELTPQEIAAIVDEVKCVHYGVGEINSLRDHLSLQLRYKEIANANQAIGNIVYLGIPYSIFDDNNSYHVYDFVGKALSIDFKNDKVEFHQHRYLEQSKIDSILNAVGYHSYRKTPTGNIYVSYSYRRKERENLLKSFESLKNVFTPEHRKQVLDDMHDKLAKLRASREC